MEPAGTAIGREKLAPPTSERIVSPESVVESQPPEHSSAHCTDGASALSVTATCEALGGGPPGTVKYRDDSQQYCSPLVGEVAMSLVVSQRLNGPTPQPGALQLAPCQLDTNPSSLAAASQPHLGSGGSGGGCGGGG